MHANKCAGPWAEAMQLMPHLEPTGNKRAELGLGDTSVTHQQRKLTEARREACCLVAILPHDPELIQGVTHLFDEYAAMSNLNLSLHKTVLIPLSPEDIR